MQLLKLQTIDMDGKEETLYRIISDLTRKNEQLEFIIDELKSELRQTKALLQATRSRTVELTQEQVILG